jgi:hypothetical protein
MRTLTVDEFIVGIGVNACKVGGTVPTEADVA